MGLGLIDEGPAKVVDGQPNLVDARAQPEPDVCGHLVIPRAGGVQAFAGIANQINQAFFDVEVNIFKSNGPFELVLGNLLGDGGQAGLDVLKVGLADQAHAVEHVGMGQRGRDVKGRQSLVECH